MNQRNHNHSRSSGLCGIVLAGGDGKRLRSFVHLLRGDSLPKQFVSFTGTRSMLTHTFQRAEMLIPPYRLYTVVNQPHYSFPEVRQQLAERAEGTVIVQPENKGSGAGLLLSLLHLHKRYPNSTVAVFPADQFAKDDAAFIKHVRLATAIVNKQPSKLVLLGVPPDSDDPGYGYIVPRNRARSDGWGSYEVSRLVEAPSPATVADLLRRNALWNTMTLVFNSATLLAFIEEARPEVARQCRILERVIDTPDEQRVVEQVYACLGPINCTRDLLEPIIRRRPHSLLSLRVDGVLWSDWGTETRVLNILRRPGNAKGLNGLPLLGRPAVAAPMRAVRRLERLRTEAYSLRAVSDR